MSDIIYAAFITGPPNGPVLFCSLVSVVVVCNAAGGPGAWAVGRPTLHGGPVRLRPVKATPCLNKIESMGLRKV